MDEQGVYANNQHCQASRLGIVYQTHLKIASIFPEKGRITKLAWLRGGRGGVKNFGKVRR